MAGRQDFWEFFDDFEGGATTVPATAEFRSPWGITDSSAAGTPTYVFGVDGGSTADAYGIAKLTLESTSEVQNICLSFDDVLQMAITDRLVFETRLKFVATADSATSLAFGLTGDRNDAIDSVAQHMLFRCIGANTVVCESDDGTTDKDDVATGQTLVAAYKYFKIDAQDLTNVKFYMTNANSRVVRVASGTTFDVSAYSGMLQPFFQIQKTADTAVDSVTIDYVRVTGRRIN